ncbi:MAG TPA: TIGR03943 family protein [Anaerolineales bacterium]|nr:TIGR03943 family protein [Anaerolineales bacterium]
MSPKLYRSFQALLLLAFGLFLIEKIFSGKLTWYINMRFFPLTLIGIALLIVMALAIYLHDRLETHEEHADHEHNTTPLANLIFLLIPLLIGILIPARPLDSAAVDSKGVNVSSPLVNSTTSTQQMQIAADQRNILDWIRIFDGNTDVTPYLGQTANVIGFVYRDDTLPANQFYVSRFAIVCCAADAVAIGVPVQWDHASALAENTWVDVKGPVKSTQLNGHPAPLILADAVDPTKQPDQPYLFP